MRACWAHKWQGFPDECVGLVAARLERVALRNGEVFPSIDSPRSSARPSVVEFLFSLTHSHSPSLPPFLPLSPRPPLPVLLSFSSCLLLYGLALSPLLPPFLGLFVLPSTKRPFYRRKRNSTLLFLHILLARILLTYFSLSAPRLPLSSLSLDVSPPPTSIISLPRATSWVLL